MAVDADFTSFMEGIYAYIHIYMYIYVCIYICAYGDIDTFLHTHIQHIGILSPVDVQTATPSDDSAKLIENNDRNLSLSHNTSLKNDNSFLQIPRTVPVLW
jgi:hypothetical protein